MRLKALSQSSRRRGQPLLPLLILLISRSETGRRSCVERKNRRSIFDPNRKYWTARRSLPRPGNHHVRNRARTSRNWSVSVLCRATPRRMLFYMAPSPWPARLYFHQSHSLKCTCRTLSVTPTPGLRKTTTDNPRPRKQMPVRPRERQAPGTVFVRAGGGSSRSRENPLSHVCIPLALHQARPLHD